MLAHIKLLTFSLTLSNVHPVHGLSKRKISADSSTVSVLLSRPAPTITIVKINSLEDRLRRSLGPLVSVIKLQPVLSQAMTTLSVNNINTNLLKVMCLLSQPDAHYVNQFSSLTACHQQVQLIN